MSHRVKGMNWATYGVGELIQEDSVLWSGTAEELARLAMILPRTIIEGVHTIRISSPTGDLLHEEEYRAHDASAKMQWAAYNEFGDLAYEAVIPWSGTAEELAHSAALIKKMRAGDDEEISEIVIWSDAEDENLDCLALFSLRVCDEFRWRVSSPAPTQRLIEMLEELAIPGLTIVGTFCPDDGGDDEVEVLYASDDAKEVEAIIEDAMSASEDGGLDFLIAPIVASEITETPTGVRAGRPPAR